MTSPLRIGVIGSGAWGTALACVIHRCGHQAVLWAHNPEVARTVTNTRENPAYLPGIRVDPAITATSDLDEALAADVLLLVVPTQYLRSVLQLAAERWPEAVPLVSCAKGLELPDGLQISEMVAEVLPGRPFAALSGPSFASEVARGLPAAVSCASTDLNLADRIGALFIDRRFRVYSSDDVIGVQLGGAVKNVLAIATGIVTGRNFGDNARAAVVTRGLAEMGRLIAARGGRRETVMGLAGLGDLVLTATSAQSRNTTVGIGLGQGQPLDAIVAGRKSVAEGVATAAAVVAQARRAGVEMPICAAVDAVINHGADLDATIEGLLARPVPREWI